MSSTHWRVRAGDGASVGEVLARMGDVARGAAAEGRAFVNGRRAREDDPVSEGDAIEVWPGRSPSGAVGQGGGPPVRVLIRRGGLVIADKPAELPVEADRRGASSVVEAVARELGIDEPIHAASRLDVGVSGAVLCAIGERARRHVAAQRTAGTIRRVYVGIAGGHVEGAGTWSAPIGRRQKGGRSVPSIGGARAEPAETRFTAIAHGRGPRRGGGVSTLLLLEPVTGRMHQLRVHAAAVGAALLGDREHGGARTIVDASGAVLPCPRIALHALAVELADEERGRLAAVAPIGPDLAGLWKALDGGDEAWDEVLRRVPPA